MVTTTTMMMMTMLIMMMVKTIGEDNDDNNGFNSRLHKAYSHRASNNFCNVMMMMSTMVRLATTTTMAHLCHDLRAHRTIFAKVFTSIVNCARSFAEESSERRALVHHCHHWPEMMLVNHSRLRGHSGRGAEH